MMHLKRVRFLAERYPTLDRYPYTLPLLKENAGFDFDAPVTFLVGDNGSGKTTLLEALAVACGIHIWRNELATRVHANRYESSFAEHLGVEWTAGRVPGSFFSAQYHKDFSRFLEEWAAVDPGQLQYFGGGSLLERSHGESVMTLLRSAYSKPGLYLADEPETALSPKRQLELVRLLAKCAREGNAQFVIATHSPILLACPGATLYSLDDAPARRIEYEETQYFRIFRDFLNDRHAYLNDPG